MATGSPFIINAKEVQSMVNLYNHGTLDGKRCYTMEITVRPLYGDGRLPDAAMKKITRLLNGIPLVPGKLPRNEQVDSIRWRYVDGKARGDTTHVFMSHPISEQEMVNSRRRLKDELVRNSRNVFGDLTVSVSLTVSQYYYYDADLIFNDVASHAGTLDELHFLD